MPPSRRPPSGRPVAFLPAVLVGTVALVAVAVALSAADPSPFTSRGVPGALGVMVSVVVALLAGPLAGVVVAVLGGFAFAILVADSELGSILAVGVWAIVALLGGTIADRFRTAGRERDIAHAAERRARQAAESESVRLANLQGLTARLATASTVREVGDALVDSVAGALGASAAGIAQLSADGSEFVVIVARGYAPGLVERWARFPVDTPVILADALSRRSVVTVSNAAEALERYPMLGNLGPEYPLGAQAAAPLLAGDSILGVIGINFDRARDFTPEDEALLLAIGRQCGLAIERARLFEAERRGRERAVRLRELASALAAASTPGEIADIASDRVSPLLGGRTGIVGAVSLDGETIELVTEGFGAEGPESIGRIPLSADRPEAEVVRTDGPLFLGSPEAMRSRYPGLAEPESGDRAWAGVPLRASGRTIGILSVSYAEPQTFEEREIAELETVADQLALALERSMLQRSLDEAVRLEARVQRVKAVSEAINPGLGVDEVAAAILAEAAEALGAAAGGLGVVTADGRNFEFISTIGVVEGAETRVPVETRGPNTDAFRTGNVVRIEHAAAWRSEYPEGSPLLGEFAEAVLGVPISAAGRRIGAIGLRFDRERSFSPDELRFVGALAEEAGEALERARLFEAEQRALKRAARLQDVTARLSRAVTTEDAARAILRAATGGGGGGGEAAVIALADDQGRSLRVIPGQMSRGTLRLRPPFDLPVSDHGAVAHVYRSGRSRWIESEAAWTDRFIEDLEPLRELGTCMYAVPIVARGEPIGALAVFFREGSSEPTSEDAELIRSFAQQAGVALERARAYEVEHEAAQALQRNLMPEALAPEPRVEVVGRYLPATRGVQVGGDWYDLVDRPDGAVALAVGDIAGHGLPAAAAMGQVRSAWRALALSASDPAAILGSLDRFVDGVDGAFFSTILTMLFDPSTNELRYASAGHPPALVIDADRTSRFLEGGRSVPLGLASDLPRPQALEVLAPGAVLVLYTDGLIERRDESLDEGLSRLGDAGVRVAGSPLAEMADELLGLVAEDRHDDVALLAVGPKLPAEVFRRSFPADAEQLAAMRSDLRAWLDRSGLPPETKEDVVLACTEAATNAIEHAYIGRDGDIRVVGESENGWLKIEISDDGRWRDPRPNDSRGRGLELVRTLIGDIDVERSERGTTVRMRVGVT